VKLMPRSSLASILLLVTTIVVLGLSPSYGQSAAPDFTLSDLNGVRFSLSDFKGRIVLIDFFATWCRPCREEILHLKALTTLYPNDTFVIISITVDPVHDTNSVLRSFAKQYEMTWIIARDTAGVANKYKVVVIPTLILIDQAGYMQSRYEGLTEKEVLQSKIEVIIPEFKMPAMILAFTVAIALFVFCRKKPRCAI